MEDEIKRKLRRESKSKLFIAKKTKFLSHKKVDIPKKKHFHILHCLINQIPPYISFHFLHFLNNQTDPKCNI